MNVFNKSLRYKSLLIPPILLIVGLFYASFIFKGITNDFLKTLGISQNSLDSKIAHGFVYGLLEHGNIDHLKYLTSGEKMSLLSDLCHYVKEYTSSDEFFDIYQSIREEARPQTPELINTDAIVREQINQFKRNISITEASYNDASIELKEIIHDGLVTLRAQLKELENPNSDMARVLTHNESQKNKALLDKYNKDVKQWEEDYPESHEEFLQSRLTYFLYVTEDVDFEAELTDSYDNLKKFANPKYEAMPAEWKKAYRAGKEATAFARKFAQQWLESIQNSDSELY